MSPFVFIKFSFIDSYTDSLSSVKNNGNCYVCAYRKFVGIKTFTYLRHFDVNNTSEPLQPDGCKRFVSLIFLCAKEK